MSTENYMGTELDDSIEIVVDENGVISIDGEVHEDLNTVSLDSGDDEVSISLSSLNHLLGKLQLNFGDESGGGDKLIITIDEAVFSNADEIKADLDLLLAEIYKEKADLLDMTKSKVEDMIEEFALKHDLDAEALQHLKATNVENIEVMVKEEPADSFFVVSEIVDTSKNANGDATSIITTSFTHDGAGQVLTQIRDFDYGTFEFIAKNTYTYTPQGDIAQDLYEFDSNADGIFDFADDTSSTHVYDANDRLLSRYEEYDEDNDGDIEEVESLTNSYDGNGNLLSSILKTSEDIDANGTVFFEEVYITTNTFDANNRLLTSLIEYDEGDDLDIQESTFITNSYDGNGNLVSSVAESEWNHNNGYPVDQIETTTNTYDANHNLLTSIIETDSSSDNDIGHGDVDGLLTIINTYDAHGNLLSNREETDWNNDGQLDQIDIITNTYDANHNLVSSRLDMDWDGDGLFNRSHITTNTYDANDNLLSSTIEYDRWSDGTIDGSNTIDYTYTEIFV